MGKPEENIGLALASDTEGFVGHLAKARGLTDRAVESAIRADSKESGAVWRANLAVEQAAFGKVAEGRRSARAALKLAPGSKDVQVEAALAYAMMGDTVRAESLAHNLNRRFPRDTQIQALWLPAIQTQLALDRKGLASVTRGPQLASSLEFGQTLFAANVSCLYPTYIRGEAYLAAGQGEAAAVEFQKVLDHGGIVWNCWTGALAHLGIARADALVARTFRGKYADAARARALSSYQDFFTIWQNADQDIPIFINAKTEYARLQGVNPGRPKARQ
jgi:tetratricopeptide (TPR) repeat protein